MKKKQLFTLLLIGVYFITMCGFFGGGKKYIKAGDRAMTKGDYETAIEYYQNAGSNAKEKLIEACMASYGECFTEDSGEEERYIYRHEKLQEDLASVMSQQEITELVIEKLQQKLEMTDGKLTDPQRELTVLDCSVYLSDCEEMRLFLAEIPASTPGYDSLLNAICNTAGNCGYKTLDDLLTDSYYREDMEDELFAWRKIGERNKPSSTITTILDNWSESKSGIGYEVNKCITQFQAGDYKEAAENLMELLPNDEVALVILNSIDIPENSTDFNQLLRYSNTMRKFSSQSIPNDIKDVLTGTEEIKIEIIEDDFSTGLTEDHKKQLKNKVGTRPDGKILILHNRNDWENHVDIYHRLMNSLPEEYYPESLESVEFIIELKRDQESVGKYTDGSAAILPYGTVTVYQAPNWTKVYSAREKGEAKTFVYGNEDKSLEPDMSLHVKKAIEKIIEANQ